MSIVKHISWDDAAERDLYFTAAAGIATAPIAFPWSSRHFVVLLAMDATAASEDTLAAYCESLVLRGCSYLCAWGPGCERVHDIFDSQCFHTESVIMSTWHADEPLDDTLWFFLRTTWTDHAYFDSTRAAIAISVGSPEWASHIERRLADISSLEHDVLQKN